MNDDDKITLGDIVIDLGDYGSVGYASNTTDTITISDTMASTITLPSSSSYTFNAVGAGGAVGATGSTISTSNWSSAYTISGIGTNTFSGATVNIDSNGIDMKEGTDIKIDGKSLKEFMTKMEQRLAILVPDPERLDKFEALKKAYEHYKTMEALCFPEKEDQE